jgi:carboxymethylenebutenolidase
VKRIAISLALSLAFAAPSFAAGSMVDVKSGNETIKAYLATPATPVKGAPAIVVVQEWWGLTDWVKGVADRFAAQGYVAIAPDLYRGKVATTPELAHELSRGVPQERAIRDVRASSTYLDQRQDLDPKKTAVIGFCMGGGWAQRAALDKGPFDAAVMCYGSPESSPEKLKTLKGPLLGIFAGDDQGIGPDQTGPLQVALAKYGKPGSAVHVYPGVGHAFLREKADTDQGKQAWAEIDAFMAKQLKPGK